MCVPLVSHNEQILSGALISYIAFDYSLLSIICSKMVNVYIGVRLINWRNFILITCFGHKGFSIREILERFVPNRTVFISENGDLLKLVVWLASFRLCVMGCDGDRCQHVLDNVYLIFLFPCVYLAFDVFPRYINGVDAMNEWMLFTVET